MEKHVCFGCMEETEHTQGPCPKCGFDAAAYVTEPHQLACGTLLRERYSVGKVLGEGGFGITYVGRDTVLDLKVAIKEFYMSGYVNRNTTHSTTVQANTGTYGETFAKNREKFLGEARVLAKFANEEGIVGIRDYFQENNTAYIVMDFLSGETLRSYIDREGKLSADRVLEILGPVIKSLGNVHSHNVIHRDISPDNIMLTDNGKVKLLDFGAAREVSNTDIRSLSIILKPGYAPEEQYRSKGKQGPWTDIYAMCATIYRCVTGIVPDDSMERMFEDKLVPPAELDCTCSVAMSNVIMKGLAVRLADRYQSVEELLADMEKAKANPGDATVAAGKKPVSAPDPDRTVYAAEPVTVKADPDATVYAEAPAPVTAPKSEPKSEPKPQPKPEPKPAPAKKPEPKPQPKAEGAKKSKKKLLIPIIIVAALVVIGLIAGGIALVASLAGNGNSEVSEEVPAPFSSFSVTLNGTEISVPTTFAELEAAGWVTSDTETMGEEVAPETIYGGYVELTNGYGYVEAYYFNPYLSTRDVRDCPIFQLYITKYDYFENYADISVNSASVPTGLVLGESTESEAKELLPRGYVKENSIYTRYTYAIDGYNSYTLGFDDGVLALIVISNQMDIATDADAFATKPPKYSMEDLTATIGGFNAVFSVGDYSYPVPATVQDYLDAGFSVDQAPEFLRSDEYETVYLRADTFNTVELQAYNPFDEAMAIEQCMVGYFGNWDVNSQNSEVTEFVLSFDGAKFTGINHETPLEDLTAYLVECGIPFTKDAEKVKVHLDGVDGNNCVNVYYSNGTISNIVINIQDAMRAYLGDLT